MCQFSVIFVLYVYTCPVWHLSMPSVAPLYAQCGTSLCPVWHLSLPSVAPLSAQCGTSLCPVWHLSAQCGTSLCPVWHLSAQCGTSLLSVAPLCPVWQVVGGQASWRPRRPTWEGVSVGLPANGGSSFSLEPRTFRQGCRCSSGLSSFAHSFIFPCHLFRDTFTVSIGPGTNSGMPPSPSFSSNTHTSMNF